LLPQGRAQGYATRFSITCPTRIWASHRQRDASITPTAAFALDPLPADDPSLKVLRQAVSALPPAARSELFVLMRMGQGDLAINNWGRGLSEAERLGEETVTAAVMEDVDLHDHLTKGLYEVTPSSELRSSSHGRQTQAEFYSRRVPQLTYLIVVKGFDHRRGEIERDGWEQ
jgi:hypothetical protein